MPKPENFITFRVTEEEKELLKQYCDQEGRTQTDILRELIRGLRRRLKPQRIHEGSALGSQCVAKDSRVGGFPDLSELSVGVPPVEATGVGSADL